MVDRTSIAKTVAAISSLMSDNREYLVSLDQVNGDGDLGISMDDGFRAVSAFLDDSEEEDLGQLLRQCANVLNEAAPSSLGTILSFGLMGMAKVLRGRTEVEFTELAHALSAGVDAIMAKAESRPGEKTILDALVPGASTLLSGADGGVDAAVMAAAHAAAEGSESTRTMRAVHGRAAYTAERSLGVLDGGSVVGRLVFEGIAAAQSA